MKRKADKSILAKLAAGLNLQSQKQYEAATLESMRAKHPASYWGFVTRLDGFGRVQRVLVSVPPSDNY